MLILYESSVDQWTVSLIRRTINLIIIRVRFPLGEDDKDRASVVDENDDDHTSSFYDYWSSSSWVRRNRAHRHLRSSTIK